MKFACVIFTCENVKKIIPINWIYGNIEKIVKRKKYLAYYNEDIKSIPPPSDTLVKNKKKKLINNSLNTIFLDDLIGKYLSYYI